MTPSDVDGYAVPYVSSPVYMQAYLNKVDVLNAKVDALQREVDHQKSLLSQLTDNYAKRRFPIMKRVLLELNAIAQGYTPLITIILCAYRFNAAVLGLVEEAFVVN